LKISKAKLYEAKVGVSETQKKWDQPGSGQGYLNLHYHIYWVPISNTPHLHYLVNIPQVLNYKRSSGS
jgi:hypothetical protein